MTTKANIEGIASNEPEKWLAELKPVSGWSHFNLRDLWRYRDLIYLFARRDFISQYKQTILGPLWFVIQPLMSTIVFTVIFNKIAKLPTDGLPPFLFYLAGNVMWTYFSACLTQISDTFVSNRGLFAKVYFPRMATPIAILLTRYLQLAIQIATFSGFAVYFYLMGSSIKPNICLLLLPVLVVMSSLLALGVGMIITSLTTRYRDLTFLVSFGVQLWMYATPIVYPLSMVPEKWRWAATLNPMAVIIEDFRYAALGSGSFDFWLLLQSGAIILGLLMVGMVVFSRMEKTFMDTV